MMRQYELVERVRAYDTNADEALLNKAYVFGLKAHGAQKRASGDPYFSHPLEVAGILTDLKLDTATIVTALLHDTIEDTAATFDEIKGAFGEEIAGLVDGVTKLSKLELISERTKDAENLRKLVVAMANDVRVLLVKLADRLHNMRTLSGIPKPEKRRRIAQETMDIYAPLAGRMGMQAVREELEDLAFAELHPAERESIVTRLKLLHERSGDLVTRIADSIKRKLAEEGIEAWVAGRMKKPYSIFRKLREKALTFEQLSDTMGFRVVVHEVADCYRALGLIHTTWAMVPERFKDFISTPKSNNYRSIHTTVMGPEQQRVEIQIRTVEMHEIAERGVAAHWSYKDRMNGREGPPSAYGLLRELVDMIDQGGSAEDFLENTRLQMFHDQVFCFTPKGQVVPLPKGATPIDFAYAIHTDIGDSCVGAKINGKPMPLRTQLKNGDEVEILRAPNQTPQPAWETMVVTGRAKFAIRRKLRAIQREEHAKLGRQLLERAFVEAEQVLTDKGLEIAAKRFKLDDVDDLLAGVGSGTITPVEVLHAVFPGLKDTLPAPAPGRKPRSAIPINGLTAGIGYTLSECCHPLPGDRIVGIMTPEQGVVIHTIDCETLEAAPPEPERWLDLSWTDDAGDLGFSVGRLDVILANEPGALATLATAIGKAGANISNLRFTDRKPAFFEMLVDVEVRDRKHLTHIIAALRASTAVNAVERVRG